MDGESFEKLRSMIVIKQQLNDIMLLPILPVASADSEEVGEEESDVASGESEQEA